MGGWEWGAAGLPPWAVVGAASFAFFQRVSGREVPAVARWVVGERYGGLEAGKQRYFDNIATSMVHSTVASVGIVDALVRDREQLKDLVDGRLTHDNVLYGLSLGYFCYDTLALVRQKRLSSDMLLHHAISIAGLGIAVGLKICQPFLFIAYSVELNSVFLHLRTLMRLVIVDPAERRASRALTAVRFANLVTFVLTRLVVHFVGLWRVWQSRSTLAWPYFLFGLASGVGGGYLNVELFRIVLRGDLS